MLHREESESHRGNCILILTAPQTRAQTDLDHPWPDKGIREALTNAKTVCPLRLLWS